MDAVVNPKDITHYDRTDAQLQTFWVFCILVAGKNSDTTSRLVHRLLTNLRTDGETPFEKLKGLGELDLHNILVANRVGQYGRIKRALLESAQLDLRTCTRQDLLNVHGVGPKTARFFLLHTREFCEEIVLDTHILRWMRDVCGVPAPKNTPQNIMEYDDLARQCRYLMEVHYGDLTLAQADLLIWTKMSGRLD